MARHHAAYGDPDTGLGATPIQDPELEAALFAEPNGEPPPVELELRYDNTPQYPVPLVAGIPIWLVLLGGTAWLIHRAYRE